MRPRIHDAKERFLVAHFFKESIINVSNLLLYFRLLTKIQADLRKLTGLEEQIMSAYTTGIVSGFNKEYLPQ